MNKEEFIQEYNDRAADIPDFHSWEQVMEASFKRDGGRKKLQIAQEELAELIQAISKYMRQVPEAKILVLEELADVTIIFHYILECCNLTQRDLDTAIDVKISREKKRLEALKNLDNFGGMDKV